MVNKELTMTEYNGTDYDALYPETVSPQVKLDTDAQDSTHLDEGASLNDALKSISQNAGGFQVGDTLISARTNLGDNWLLCNGDLILASKYPELLKNIDASMFDFNKIGEASGIESSIKEVTVVTNQSVANEQFMISIQGNNSAVFAGNNLVNSPEWTKLISDKYHSYRVRYQNGMWFILTDTTGTSPNGSARYYSGDNISMDNFKDVNGLTGKVTDVVYNNGKYYFLVTKAKGDDNVRYVYMYTDLNAAPVIIEIGGVSYYSEFLSVVPEGVVCSRRQYYNSQKKNYYIDMIVVDSLGNTTTKTIASPDDSTYGTMTDTRVIYFNNTYWLMAYHIGLEDGSNGMTLFTSRGLDGIYGQVYTSDKKRIKMYAQAEGKFETINDDMLIFPNGYYFTKAGNTTPYKWDNNVSSTISSAVVVGNNNYYYTTVIDDVIYSYSQPIAQNIKLPIFSPASGLYAYIKVKSRSNCTLTVDTTPSEASVEVKDALGEVVSPQTGTTNVFTLDNISGKYTVLVSKEGYVSKTQTITNNKSQTINVTLEKTSDGE